MRNNDVIAFIDSKGVTHNALVKAFREHRDEKGELVDLDPLVTLTYNLPTGEPKELIDVHHMDHPIKQEPNPDLPTYALHVWKYQDEDHLVVPSDHPLHDHPYEAQKLDDAGNPIPKRRPIYEKHIQWHKQSIEAQTPPYLTEPAGNKLPGARRGGPVAIVDEFSQPERTGDTGDLGVSAIAGQRSEVADPNPVGPGTQEKVPVGHPAHPETIHFEQGCVSCGKKVRRVASHQGGQQWDIDAPVQHVCKQADIEAFRESLKPKREPEMTELQKAALEPAGDPPKPEAEVDVITELENAPPAPDEPQSQNEGEQAEG